MQGRSIVQRLESQILEPFWIAFFNLSHFEQEGWQLRPPISIFEPPSTIACVNVCFLSRIFQKIGHLNTIFSDISWVLRTLKAPATPPRKAKKSLLLQTRSLSDGDLGVNKAHVVNGGCTLAKILVCLRKALNLTSTYSNKGRDIAIIIRSTGNLWKKTREIPCSSSKP